jgi:hypothetical protein
MYQPEPEIGFALLSVPLVLALLYGVPAFWRLYWARHNRRPWYAEFYRNYTGDMR